MSSNFTQTIYRSYSSLEKNSISSHFESLQSRVLGDSLPSISSFLPTPSHDFLPSFEMSSRSSFVLSLLDSLSSLEMFSKSHLETMHSRVFYDSLPLMILMEWSSISSFSFLIQYVSSSFSHRSLVEVNCPMLSLIGLESPLRMVLRANASFFFPSL
jgi:hypothetical protein